MKSPVLFLLIFSAVAGTSPANPPAPPPGRETETFVPHAGFVRTIRKQQLEARLAPPFAGAPIPPGGIRGARRLPVICVEFSEGGHPYEVCSYRDLLFGNPSNRKTMTQYYRDISRGTLTVSGDIFGWYQLPQKDVYYENGQTGWGAPFGEFLQTAFERADAEVDFGLYDNDGPDRVPNSGDDDGKVDTVVLIHPEIGGEFNKTNIWSHSSHYSNSGLGHSAPFSTHDLRKDASGQPLLGPYGEKQYIVIEDYVVQPGLGNERDDMPKRLIDIGVFCHEFGHALGLPDLYDRSPPPPKNQSADSSGVGNWCLMAAGSYGGDYDHSGTPTEMSAWGKMMLGWANVVQIEQEGLIDLEPVCERNLVYRIDVPGTEGKEYFLAEYRDPTWKDPGNLRVNWDEYLPAAGLAIWHIDENVGALLPGPAKQPNDKWPFADIDQGQNDAPSLPKTTASGASWRAKHSLVALVQADGVNLLESGPWQKAIAGHLFRTGMVWEDDPSLRRGSRGYNGAATGVGIKDINLANRTAYVTFAAPPQAPLGVAPPPPPAVGAPAPPAGNALAALRTWQLASAPLSANRTKALGDLNAILNQADITVSMSKAVAIESPSDPSRTNPESRDAATEQKANLLSELKKRAAKANMAFDGLILNDLKTVTEAEINTGIEPRNRPFIRSLSAEARTKTVTKDSSPGSPVEQSIVQLLQEQAPLAKAKVRVNPVGDRIERLTDVNLPIVGTSIVDDAKKRLSGDLGQALIGDAVMEKTENKTPQPGTVRFQQFYKIGDHTLPVWGATITFFYTNENLPKLSAIVSQAKSAQKLQTSGQPGSLAIEEAAKIAAKQLKVAESQLVGGEEGVKILPLDPSRGRVGIKFRLPVGEEQRDLEIFVDAESKQVLAVE